MTLNSPPIVQIHGATGAIGGALCEFFTRKGWSVAAVSRSSPKKGNQDACNWQQWSIGADDYALEPPGGGAYSAIAWAQGMNFNDNISSFSRERHLELYEANVVHVMESLSILIRKGWLTEGAKLCIISSIWQNLARQNKMSYCVTKAALQGLVRSLAIDLGPERILVNAVLPGALDTPMTLSNLSPEQIHKITETTPLGTLPTLTDVCELTYFLCSDANSGLTGQFIEADRGFSYARML